MSSGGFNGMRSALLGATACGALLLGSMTSASADVTIGAFNTGNCYPFMCNDSGVGAGQSIEYQQVYSP